MSDASNPTSGGHQGRHEEQGESSTQEGSSRSLFGRIFDALNPQETPSRQPSSDGFEGIGKLRQLRVEDVAIPTAEIVSVSVDTSFSHLIETFRESGMSRIPVYEGSLDSPIGVVHLKDLALKFGFGAELSEFDLRAILRPVLYALPSMPLAVLLQKMQAERIHMALVIDEYGGIDGLVTIEDLIETVVGEIEDEHDVEEQDELVQESQGVWVADAAYALSDFTKISGFDLTAHDDIDEEEVDTLGGLAFMLSGDVPDKGDVIEHPDGARLEVLDADNRRIKKLRIKLPEAVLA